MLVRWAGRNRDRGSFAVELAVIAPVLIALLWVLISAGRLVQTASRVESAARDAARAASINHNGRALEAARTAMDASLKAHGVTCVGPPTFDSAGSDLEPGGRVHIVVSCRVAILFGTGTTTVTR